MEENLVKLSRTLAYALRHHPDEFGLTLDNEGWVPVKDLLTALKQRGSWKAVRADDLTTIIMQSNKKRYEMRDGMIRAFYGHSTKQKLLHEAALPPAVLFHGTTKEAAQAIRVDGLKPMKRQYVHLSADQQTARIVALRRTQKPVILQVQALQAHQHGIQFYPNNDTVWLANAIPPQFINFGDKDQQ